MKSLKQSHRIKVLKHVSGFFATGRCMKMRKQRLTDECSRCNTPDETKTHIITCPEADAERKLRFTVFCNSLISYITDPDITDAIIRKMDAWRHGRPVNELQVAPKLREAVAIQDALGWETAFTGC